MNRPLADTAAERIAFLERENARIFEAAQREADAMFAQYQLSQLLASGGTPGELADAVASELARLSGAAAVALWLAEPGGSALRLITVAGEPPSRAPAEFATDQAAREWCAAQPGCAALTLVDERTAGLVALFAPTGETLDPDELRVLQLSRHELAVALRGAQVRTALERERRELTAIFEGATDAIVQVDGASRVVRVNPAAERLLGVSAAEAIGQRCDALFGCALAGGHDPTSCPLAEVIAGGEPIAYRESAVIGADRSVVHVVGGYSRSAATSPSEAGTPLRATAILRDVSAARALEELREGFVATVSHELRTPLALMKGYADTLLHLELDDDEQRAYLERMAHTTERLTDLVTEILDIAHLDADPLVLERTPMLLSSLVAHLLNDLAVAGHADRVRANLDPPPPPIEADPSRIGQVLDNLVSNALKYARPESIVTIDAEADGDWLVVSVEDEGMGVPPGDDGLVFEPFHRARNVRESSIPGTGLGLYISRRLVEAHGGRLWLESRRDGRRGTCARFTLPLAPGRRPVPADARPGVAEPA